MLAETGRTTYQSPMKFVDEVEIDVAAGDGGNGCAAFRREKFMPMGGPSGGDGGRGGDVIFRAQDRMSTLLDFQYRTVVGAPRGENGRGKDQFGRGGEDLVVDVPVGTQVFDAETGEMIADLDERDKTAVIARGGQGGRGNMRFATSFDRAPRKAEPGERGERKRVRLELKLLADVGVIGFPNVGKSTFISTVSRATPKIADYPFTTLVPNLGVVSLGEDRTFVIADIPGIIEGAAEGAGLGIRFLKHIERNRALLHILTIDYDEDRDPVSDFDVLMKELAAFNEQLSTRPMVVALSKSDLPDVRDKEEEIRAAMKERGHTLLMFSSASRQGITPILEALHALLLANGGSDESRPKLTAADRPHGHTKGWSLPADADMGEDTAQ